MSRVVQDGSRFVTTRVPSRTGQRSRQQRTRLSAALQLAGFPVRNARHESLSRLLRQRLDSGRKMAVGFVNQNFVITCRDLRVGRWADDSLILVNDGVGMNLAAKLRFGRGFRENMNGTDFVPRFLTETPRPLSVFLIGSEAAVLAKAAAVIDALPQCRVVGLCDGYSLWQREDAVLAELKAAAPDVLLVGLGNPIQERWILKHWDNLDAKLIFGVGALFEWWSGYRRRAPVVVRRLRLEWLYRLVLEPRRLARRYTIGILQFFALVLFRSGSRKEAIS